MSEHNDNPCLSCGACCRSFRVSFYWAEADERGLPPSLVEQVTALISCMAGTNSNSPRCIALGKSDAGPMTCRIYDQRPEPCREVQPGDDKCRRARARHGLQPLPA